MLRLDVIDWALQVLQLCQVLQDLLVLVVVSDVINRTLETWEISSPGSGLLVVVLVQDLIDWSLEILQSRDMFFNFFKVVGPLDVIYRPGELLQA